MEHVGVRSRLGWLPLPLAMALACWLYRPWRPRPFDVLDFSEFLPFLNRSEGLGAQFSSLVDYYARVHGRFNVLSYGALVLKWSVLGPHPVLWQLVRAILICAVAGLVYLLLRRLAAGSLAAAAGAILFLFSYSAAVPWVRLTMGEPLGLLLAILAALGATRVPPGSSWARVLAPGVLMAGAILAKEMLVLWVPVVMLVGVTRDPSGKLSTWRWDPTIRRFLLLTAGCSVLAMVPILLVAAGYSSTGYAASYGSAAISTRRFLELLQRQVLPWPITGRGDAVTMLLVVVGALALVLGGMRASLSNPIWRRHALMALAVGIGLPILGTMAYLPWPLYQSFYGYPFLFGPALLLATSLSAIQVKSGRAARWANGATLLGLVLIIPEAARLASTTAAQQEIVTGLAAAVARARPVNPIVAAVAIPPMQPWQGTGPSLSRYAMATVPGLALPPARDVSCEEALRLLGGLEPVTLISLDNGCGAIPGAQTTIRTAYRYWRWEPPGFGVDTVRGTMRILP